MNNNRPKMWVALILLIITSIACNLTSFSDREPKNSHIPVSSEVVEDLEQEIQSAIATAQSGGPVQIVITEEQLTSLVSMWLQSQGNTPVKELQIHLQSGQIILTGTVEQSGLDLSLNIVLDVYVDASGKPRSRVIQATVGPFPLPESILDQITLQLDQALIDQIDSSLVVVDSVDIQDGYMTINGHNRQ